MIGKHLCALGDEHASRPGRLQASSSLRRLPPSRQNTPYKAPRTADGKPNLNGIWQALDTSINWDIQGHAASAGPVAALGAAYSVPPGLGIVEGGPIPYLPAALAKKKENYEKRLTDDPEIKCYMPGRAARQLHAVSISDFSERQLRHDRLRIRQRRAHHLYG